MAISSAGIGSGLDVQGIVSQLVSAESGPTTFRLNRQEAVFQAEISAFGALKSSLSEFQSSLTNLTDITNFQKRSAVSSDFSMLSATADETAAKGSYSVEVNRLAQAHKYSSQAYLSTDTIGGGAGATDTLDITVGANTLSIDLTTAKTLEEIQLEITSAAEIAGVDVNASLVSGDGGNQTLVLNSGSEGFENRVQVGGTIEVAGVPTASDTVMGFSTLNKLADGSPLASEAELDAEILVDGVTVTRATNAIDDAVSGVTFNLTKAEVGTSVTVDVSLNTSTIESNVKKLVESYNTLATVINDFSQVNDDNTRGILVGDAILRGLSLGIRNELSREVGGISGSYNSLASLGVTTTLDGKLELDSEKLNTAVTSNFADMGQLFASDDGVGVRLDAYVDSYVKANGLLDSKIEGLNKSVAGIADERVSLDQRMEKIEARYLKQFSGLDTLMATMQLTSSFLTQQLDNLPGSTFNRDR